VSGPGASNYGCNVATWSTHRGFDAFPGVREAGGFHETIVGHEQSELQDLFRNLDCQR
jgi:hypothetical protein